MPCIFFFFVMICSCTYDVYDVRCIYSNSILPTNYEQGSKSLLVPFSFLVFKVNFTSIQLYHMDMAEMSTDAISIMSKFLLPALSFLL